MQKGAKQMSAKQAINLPIYSPSGSSVHTALYPDRVTEPSVRNLTVMLLQLMKGPGMVSPQYF